MIILPAIDIKDGNCVRLKKGDFHTVEKVAENPFNTAKAFAQAGASHLHMVDLDGAKDAKMSNRDLFVEMAKQTNLKIELGGGIRTMEAVEYYLSHGIHRVILGSAAVKDPDFLKLAVKEYQQHIIVGIDARDGQVATEGWLDTTQINYIDFAKQMEQMGVKQIIFTDIAKDGMLTGPNLDQLKAISQAVSCDITASGGICNLEDIKSLKRIGMYGAICGKSLYQGSLDLKQAISIAEGESIC